MPMFYKNNIISEHKKHLLERIDELVNEISVLQLTFTHISEEGNYDDQLYKLKQADVRLLELEKTITQGTFKK